MRKYARSASGYELPFLLTGALLAAFIACFVQPLSAQESRGTIRGEVTDPTHAVVPNAKVTLHNVGTGVELTKQVDTSGFYVFDPVVPGTYRVVVESPGFEKFVQENVVVQTASDITVNAILTIGAVTQTVEVTTNVGQVEFNTSTMSDTVQQSFLKDLPILARNPFTLALLDAGVINEYWDEAHRLPFYMWSDGGLDIGGPTGGKNEQIIDGFRTDMAARGSYNANMDAVQEVVVQQQIPDAEHGWSGGGAVNISTKSGTNDIHGDAYGMWRQPNFNALANRVTRSADIVKQNIYGFTVGNPIIKNKLFNFFAFEKWNSTQPNTVYETVPTMAERAGDFSGALQSNGQLRPIDDPLTTTYNAATGTYTRQQFPGNIIPTNRMDPVGLAAMNYLWAPNRTPDNPSGLNNFSVTYPWWTKYHNLSERVDYNASDKLRLYARYSWFRTRLDNNNASGDNSIAWPSDNGGIMDATSSGIDALYMMNPRTTIDVRLGVNYTEDDYNSSIYKLNMGTQCSGSSPSTNCNVWQSFWPNDNWYQSELSPSIGVYFPAFQWGNEYFGGSTSGIGTGAHMGFGGWWYDHLRTYSPSIIVTHEMGKHHLKFGWQYRYEWMQNFQSVGPGYFGFNSQDTSNVVSGSYNPDFSGDQYASSLLGVVDNAYATIYPIVDQVHNHLYAGFIQDDFRLNPRTTLNLGIRWEKESGPSDDNHWLIKTLDTKQNIQNWPSSFNLWTPQVIAAAKLPANAANLPYLVASQYNGAAVRTSATDPNVYYGVNNTFLPRAGVAYRLNDKTALRVGWSRFAVTWLSNSSDDSDIFANGYSQTTDALGPLAGIPRSYLAHPYPTGGTYPNPIIPAVGNALGPYQDLGNSWSFYDMRQYKVPINDRFNFNIQRELPGNFRLDVTEFLMFEHNAQDGSMWGGYGSGIGSLAGAAPFYQNVNMMNPMYNYTYKGLLTENVPNPFYGQFPTSLAAAGVSSVTPSYTGLPIMPGSLGTSSQVSLSQLLRPYPQYGDLNLWATPGNRDHYSGLAVSVTRPFAHGWTFLGTYNYSIQNHTAFYDDIDQYNRHLTMWDRGLPRHNIRMSGTYQLPFGKGRTYFSTVPKWVDEVIGGWSTSQIFYFMGGDLLGFPESGMLCDPRQNKPNGYWFNPNCITTPPSYTIPTALPYYEGLRGPRFWQLDSTASKTFNINERFNLEFRLEMYNTPNSFIPGDPCVGSSCGTSDGKSLTEAAGANGANYGRELQGSLRLHF
ncbi:MAG: carboxypeptidase-like regulatory domain-containing protein [Terriglobia bacterium]|jgi:hypothetical protein